MMTKPSTSENEVIMRRADLKNLPNFDLPDGFTLRAYRNGDDATWWQIHERADPLLAHRSGSHREFFGDDFAALQARQLFLVSPANEAIGTASAWWDDDEIGRVHWVAIVPEFQERGLAKPLIARVLQLLREHGHSRAILTTSLQRPRAIALYRSFGFAIV